MLRPIVFVSGGFEACEQFTADLEETDSEAAIRMALEPHANSLGKSSNEILRACRDALNLGDVRRALGLDLTDFNVALRELGRPYQPLNFAAMHREIFGEYLKRWRSSILESLRHAHADVFDACQPLDQYVSAREVNELESDEDWAESYEELPETVIIAAINTWLVQQKAPALGAQPLDNVPLDETRKYNRHCLRSFAQEAGPLVLAWCRRNQCAVPDPWGSPENFDKRLSETAERQGWLDFRRLQEKSIIERLQSSGSWPSEMPANLKLKVLELDERDLRKATEEAEERKRDAERQRRTIKLAGEDIVVGETNYSDISERVATLVAENEQLLETPANVRSVTPIETGGHRTRGPKKGAGKGSHRPSMTDEQRRAIGFIGEQIAFEWLKKQFGKAVSEACWVSGNRDLAFGTDDGDDSRGYDFEVSEGARTLYYEVKATSGTETVIELGPSEIRAAERYRSDRRRQFRIIFISEALDPGKSSLYVLPNPSSKSGKQYFRAFPRSSVRFEFSLK